VQSLQDQGKSFLPTVYAKLKERNINLPFLATKEEEESKENVPEDKDTEQQDLGETEEEKNPQDRELVEARSENLFHYERTQNLVEEIDKVLYLIFLFLKYCRKWEIWKSCLKRFSN